MPRNKKISMDNFALDTPSYRLLLVEDDQELAGLICEFLIKSGFDVTHLSHGGDAVHYIQQHAPDLVILDVMLPGLSGMEVCKQVRPFFYQPILMLTALDEDMDQMLGLELGADDYVIKPVKPRLLLSRICALLRRVETDRQVAQGVISTNTSHMAEDSVSAPVLGARSSTAGSLVNGRLINEGSVNERLVIDLSARSVMCCQASVHLTTAEFDLLVLLAEHQGQIVSRDDIVRNLRGFDYDGLDRSIDRRISRVRKKLGDNPSEPVIIKTIRGKGYLLSLPAEIR
ncbi:DNA-binding response regulator [Litoribrevibacter albus]|uniref:DNA-binding response regulator n=2 Tax=Litoribrevibacter albus TaxID=1473156 RepID=A0AA37SDZ5_9GAMM|nr:DNA-binding response regulator [Litoribrevibacter albus]